MSELIATVRAIIRNELARLRLPELGTVTQVLAREAEAGKENHQVHVKLHASGVELQHVAVLSARIGLSALPAVGDLVLVAFVGGDLNAPVAVGCLYDDTAHPPVARPPEVVYAPPEGEDAEIRRFHLELQSGATVTVHDDRVVVVLGGTSITVEQDGAVAVAAAGDLRLTAGGNVEIGADRNVTLKGVNVTIEAQGQAKVKGASIGLAGSTAFSPT